MVITNVKHKSIILLFSLHVGESLRFCYFIFYKGNKKICSFYKFALLALLLLFILFKRFELFAGASSSESSLSSISTCC